MEEVLTKKNAFYYIGLVCGFLAIAACITTVGFAIADSYISIYTLAIALAFLGINRIGLHMSNFKKNMFSTIFLTAFIFILTVLVGLTKFSIYFLISAMFCYSLTIIGQCILKMRDDRSLQSLIFHSLCIALAFIFSFVFFFPVIYAKHATSVSNSNFIVLCFSSMIIVSSSKNLVIPYKAKLKLHIISKIIRKSLVKEILAGLAILIVLCSVYFTVVEPAIQSYVDALWYSFSVITTIGFGDVYVVTTFGRIISVILGISGIVVVALVTSFIVNFYNEMREKREEKTLRKLIEEAKELEKLEELKNKEVKEKTN